MKTMKQKRTRKKRTRNKETRRKKYVAFHEAGHAVVADWYAFDFVVTIDDTPHIALQSTHVEIACQVMFAGPLSQAKYQKQGLVPILITDGACDMEYINTQADMWADVRLKDYKRRQWRESAAWVLKKRWDLVEAVAERLMECGHLTSDEVREIAVSSGHDHQDLLYPYD